MVDSVFDVGFDVRIKIFFGVIVVVVRLDGFGVSFDGLFGVKEFGKLFFEVGFVVFLFVFDLLVVSKVSRDGIGLFYYFCGW